jgi:hypothetical protein
MLLPRFSIRLLLLLNALFAAIFLVTKFAIDGRAWAWGFVLASVAAGLLMGTFGLMFLAAYLLSAVRRPGRRLATESPFATDKLPPQVIPPRYIDD